MRQQTARLKSGHLSPPSAPLFRPASSFWHRWGRADFGRGPIRAEAGEIPHGKGRVKACLMIQADPLRAHQVLDEIRSLRVTTEAREAMGPFNIVAFVEADSITDLAPLLHEATFTISGVYAAAAVLTESDSWRDEGSVLHG